MTTYQHVEIKCPACGSPVRDLRCTSYSTFDRIEVFSDQFVIGQCASHDNVLAVCPHCDSVVDKSNASYLRTLKEPEEHVSPEQLRILLSAFDDNLSEGELELQVRKHSAEHAQMTSLAEWLDANPAFRKATVNEYDTYLHSTRCNPKDEISLRLDLWQLLNHDAFDPRFPSLDRFNDSSYSAIVSMAETYPAVRVDSSRAALVRELLMSLDDKSRTTVLSHFTADVPGPDRRGRNRSDQRTRDREIAIGEYLLQCVDHIERTLSRRRQNLDRVIELLRGPTVTKRILLRIGHAFDSDRNAKHKMLLAEAYREQGEFEASVNVAPIDHSVLGGYAAEIVRLAEHRSILVARLVAD